MLAMARVGGNGSSMGSQFFIVYKDSPIPADAAGCYTVFGKITGGLGVVQAIAAVGTDGAAGDGKPKTPVTMSALNVK
jgi:peptidyl-prolyl cis-trans isomerase B (cyclophilin B)